MHLCKTGTPRSGAEPTGTLLPCDLPLPEPGSFVDGVLYLHSDDQAVRDEMIDTHRECSDYVAISHGENDLLPTGWLLFCNNRAALFRAMTHWDDYPWRAKYVIDAAITLALIEERDQMMAAGNWCTEDETLFQKRKQHAGYWALEGIPRSLSRSNFAPAYANSLTRAISDPTLDPAQVKNLFLEDLALDHGDIPGLDFTALPHAVADAERRLSDMLDVAEKVAADLCVKIPRAASARTALRDWLLQYLPLWEAARIATTYGACLPSQTNAQSVLEWTGRWRRLVRSLESGSVSLDEFCRIRDAWEVLDKMPDGRTH